MALRRPSAPCYVCSLKIAKKPSAPCAPFGEHIVLLFPWTRSTLLCRVQGANIFSLFWNLENIDCFGLSEKPFVFCYTIYKNLDLLAFLKTLVPKLETQKNTSLGHTGRSRRRHHFLNYVNPLTTV